MTFPLHSYPSSIEDELDLFTAINNFATICIGRIDASQTGIAIEDDTGLPASGMLSIDNEIILYEFINTSGANPVLSNCHRGYDDTQAAIHSDGAAVEMRWVAKNHNAVVNSIIAIENELGVTPKGSYSSVAARLSANLPALIQTPINPMTPTDWSFTHTRKRLVGVQLWRFNEDTNNYELFTAPIEQVVDPMGTSQVNINLTEPETGYIVIN